MAAANFLSDVLDQRVKILSIIFLKHPLSNDASNQRPELINMLVDQLLIEVGVDLFQVIKAKGRA
jgi:hypothetical protein